MKKVAILAILIIGLLAPIISATVPMSYVTKSEDTSLQAVSVSPHPLTLPTGVWGYVRHAETGLPISGARLLFIKMIVFAPCSTLSDGMYVVQSRFLRYDCTAIVWAQFCWPQFVHVYLQPEKMNQVDFYLRGI